MPSRRRYRSQRPMGNRTHLIVKFWHKDWLAGNGFLPLVSDVVALFLNGKFKKNVHWPPAYDVQPGTKAASTLKPEGNFDAEIYIEARFPVTKQEGDVIAMQLEKAVDRLLKATMKTMTALRRVRLTLKYICDGEAYEIEKEYESEWSITPKIEPKHYPEIMTLNGPVPTRPQR